ncbi:MAG: Aspartyl/glutamyl-tRNA(Asn/Gln) amidotransferase subunit B [Chloroflexi bacterium ADurb.Bin360]|nr:MAG: Aspartyl/glutamyl-tRNA(Asn/Gln) amidotransferase subunit B [Chloroflexi bacterium ADurb.Bin360]
MSYEAIIGLEVHAQVQSRSKMYCACPVVEDTGDLQPNTYVCPVCLALPGSLPVVNRRAVELGVQAALALHCTVAPESVFARKSYFYPDLPKGYQISQYDLPLATDGYLEVQTGAGANRIRITRVHLEEDTGKLIHQQDGAWVDYNRAGVPLLEIVSAPDLRTVEEVRAYAMMLRADLVALGVNSGDMEKGALRFEANVSVRPVGAAALGTRTEIKNLNSFRALARAVEAEVQRQIATLESGRSIEQQTLGWDEARGATFVMRGKEHAHDYRYFPEPDIPPVQVSAAWIETLRAALPELPAARVQRFITTYGLRVAEAQLLSGESSVAAYFEAVMAAADGTVAAQDIANWITGEFFRLFKEHHLSMEQCRVTPLQLVRLQQLRQMRALSSTAAKAVLVEMFQTGEVPEVASERLGVLQLSDGVALQNWAERVIAANPTQVAQYLSGKSAVLGWLVGQIMATSQGRANPQQAREALLTALERWRSTS